VVEFNNVGWAGVNTSNQMFLQRNCFLAETISERVGLKTKWR